MIELVFAAALAKKPPPPMPGPAFEDVAAELVGQALTSDAAWNDLVHLSTRIGARFSGSPALDAATAWGADRMVAWGLTGVKVEQVTLKGWSRGTLAIEAVAPFAKPMSALSLGGSVGSSGLEADVIVVSDWKEFEALPDDSVRGRIVVWNAPFTTYGETVGYRFAGASVAARRGAVASLVRSVTPESLSTPHTGTQRYEDDVPQIPAVAITVEDAVWLHQIQLQGVTPRIRLASTAMVLPDVPGANVIGEVLGREKPDEIVLLGCHIDSWDVGQGAQDDGAGCVQAMTAVGLIARQPVAPRRTVRVVLFTGEEYGVGGARAYAAAHGGERHFAGIEADTGAGAPFGFRVDTRLVGGEDPDPARVDATIAALAHLEGALSSIAADQLVIGHGGTDIDPLIMKGMPGFGVWHDTTGYWPIHHTHADTIDKVDPAALDKGVAAMAVLGWALADFEGELP